MLDSYKDKVTFRRAACIISSIGMLVMAFSASAAMKPDAGDASVFLRPSGIPQPANNLSTPERVKLGKMLFFDPRLSGSNWISCGTCHNPALGWSDGLKTAIGHNMKVLERSTPTILNTGYQGLQFWDGRERTLEKQALGPIVSPGEMAQDLDELVKELKAVPEYVALFKEAYPDEGVSKTAIGKAIASFERTVVSQDSSFDRWLKGMESDMSKAAMNGFKLFKGKARCIMCHNGFNFADDGFHNIGLPGNKDEGRYAIKKVKVMKGAFKTPTLRDVGLTAPYMHNGEFGTLKEVIEHYNSGGKKNLGNLDPNMQALHLSKKEKSDLLEFLLSLTGDAMEVSIPQLPVNH
ncbi:MAG: c-type cytochrome [Gammaproteobacteria bacterium]|nr:c-type cytochrome [Gammaproteobacteria bacterium]